MVLSGHGLNGSCDHELGVCPAEGAAFGEGRGMGVVHWSGSPRLWLRFECENCISRTWVGRCRWELMWCVERCSRARESCGSLVC